jgi:hypothetical protein
MRAPRKPKAKKSLVRPSETGQKMVQMEFFIKKIDLKDVSHVIVIHELMEMFHFLIPNDEISEEERKYLGDCVNIKFSNDDAGFCMPAWLRLGLATATTKEQELVWGKWDEYKLNCTDYVRFPPNVYCNHCYIFHFE